MLAKGIRAFLRKAVQIHQGAETLTPLLEHPSQPHLLLTLAVPTAEAHRPRACTAPSHVGSPLETPRRVGSPCGQLRHPWPPSSRLLTGPPPPPSAGLQGEPCTGLRPAGRHSLLSCFSAVCCVCLSGLVSYQHSHGNGSAAWFTQATVSPPLIEGTPCRVARAGDPENPASGSPGEDGQEA